MTLRSSFVLVVLLVDLRGDYFKYLTYVSFIIHSINMTSAVQLILTNKSMSKPKNNSINLYVYCLSYFRSR